MQPAQHDGFVPQIAEFQANFRYFLLTFESHKFKAARACHFGKGTHVFSLPVASGGGIVELMAVNPSLLISCTMGL
jgi:hypothetical protein